MINTKTMKTIYDQTKVPRVIFAHTPKNNTLQKKLQLKKMCLFLEYDVDDDDDGGGEEDKDNGKCS